ncbi:hypothetical protein OTU49_015779 [Cherax quadricarinatus]|uniref:Uncharacterized protein n=1 Tax=Cherax quadricarinatus TaxID=27406 RepID=A0AAW0XXK4_CHEQU
MAPTTSAGSRRTPASPRQVASSVASSVVASVQYVTASVRVLLVGCFQCSSIKPACWRRQRQQDGAWFDSDKLQVEHPYCYVNPVALSDVLPETASTPTQQSLPQNQQPKSLQHPKLLQEAKPLEQLKPLHQSKTLHDAKSTQNGLPPGDNHVSQGLNIIYTPEFNTKVCDKPLVSAGENHEGTTIHYNNDRVKSPLVESFAAKLEADLRKLESDRQRAEGEVLRPLTETIIHDDTDSVSQYVWKESERSLGFQDEEEPYRPYYCVNFEDDRGVESEVWKPSELEEVFECYNMAAFYSYGATLQISEKFPSKIRGEKYEEIFPTSFHNNNNNNTIVKVFKSASESGQTLALTDTNSVLKENLPENESVQRKQTVTEDQLKELVCRCVEAESVGDVNFSFPGEGTSTNVMCYDSVYFGDRSFNKLLIFDLVKSVMSECKEYYPHSLSLCVDYPVHLVQNRVLCILQKAKDDTNLNPTGMQVFRSGSLCVSESNWQHKQLLADTLVESIVASEVHLQDPAWQDFSQEELELKEAISNELLNDLISESATLFSSILKKKLLQ